MCQKRLFFVVLLFLFVFYEQVLAKGNLYYTTFFHPHSESLIVYIAYNIYSPEMVDGLKEDNGFSFDYNVEIVINKKVAPREYDLVFDTTYDKHFKNVPSLDATFYETLWLNLPSFNEGEIIIVVSDYNSSKFIKENYFFSVKTPLNFDLDFVGTSMIPFIEQGHSKYPLIDKTIPLGFEIFEIYVEFYAFGAHKHFVNVTLTNNDQVIFQENVVVSEVNAYTIKVFLEKIEYGDLEFRVIYDNKYEYRAKFEYVFGNDKAGRLIAALKYVSIPSLWKKYFKDLDKNQRVRALLRFVNEMKNKDKYFLEKWNEFLLRFEYAERFFVEGTLRGYETDRGWVLIVYGWPEDIQVFSALEYHIYKDLMVWYYYHDNFAIVFERMGVGDNWRVKPFAPPSTSKELRFSE